ncbi:uncharacterized protein LOC110239161 [Exaiptasia diaphana]|uniref:CCHC-type domain-containing protein n=1 Tax=Exaiptasia diaphana TaxID=2652724 RepID=A0A913X9K3_EXADI|nr:uncharacterized protein LOC110239161 [Exaiptasia diaphana]KXJ28524.1 hypothetical protein AC249_AIPGENE17363 [Exaiptasia diaphana]
MSQNNAVQYPEPTGDAEEPVVEEAQAEEPRAEAGQNPPEPNPQLGQGGQLKTLRKNIGILEKSVAELTRLTLKGVIKRIMDYVTRPVSEFNKYEAVDLLLESLQNTARGNQDGKKEYYRLVYQTARSKIDLPKDHFRSLVMRLLGSKDHTTVFEAVAKVEKAARGRGASWGSSTWPRSTPWNRGRAWRGASPQCYACRKYGHIAARCFRRNPGTRQQYTRGRGGSQTGSSNSGN